MNGRTVGLPTEIPKSIGSPSNQHQWRGTNRSTHRPDCTVDHRNLASLTVMSFYNISEWIFLDGVFKVCQKVSQLWPLGFHVTVFHFLLQLIFSRVMLRCCSATWRPSVTTSATSSVVLQNAITEKLSDRFGWILKKIPLNFGGDLDRDQDPGIF